jgi:hypothetical protein
MDTYTFEHDPGHGWLGVPLDELIELDIPHKISTCSYWDCVSELVWLEEDMDLATFARAKAAKETESASEDVGEDWIVNVFFERMVTDIHTDHESRLRRLPRFDVVAVQQERNAYVDPRWLSIREAV